MLLYSYDITRFTMVGARSLKSLASKNARLARQPSGTVVKS
jgi:hypothetical protein